MKLDFEFRISNFEFIGAGERSGELGVVPAFGRRRVGISEFGFVGPGRANAQFSILNFELLARERSQVD